MTIVFALALRLLVLLVTAWPSVWVVHLVVLAKRRRWSRFFFSGALALPYLAAIAAFMALFLGGHNGPNDQTTHRVMWGSAIGVLIVWILLLASIFTSRAKAR